MWGGRGRRSLFRPGDAAASSPSQRSSSLPPEADRPIVVAAAAAPRGRHANPIGVSRRSTATKAPGADVGDPFRQRSQSLTRPHAPAGGAGSGGLVRADSFASIGSHGSDLEEPGWFSHAFHDVRDSGKGPSAPAASERGGDGATRGAEGGAAAAAVGTPPPPSASSGNDASGVVASSSPSPSSVHSTGIQSSEPSATRRSDSGDQCDISTRSDHATPARIHQPRPQQEQHDNDQRYGHSSGGGLSSHVAGGHGELDKLRQQVASLQGSKGQNDSTIEALRQQLADLANEHGSFRHNSERMADIMTKQKGQLKKELTAERKGVVEARTVHEREVEEWRSKALGHERRRKDAESEVAKLAEQLERKEREEAAGTATLRLQLSEAEARHGARLRQLETEKRKGVADARTVHEREIEEWRSRALEHERRRKDAESECATRAEQREREEAEGTAALRLQLSESESRHGARVRQLESEKASMQHERDEWKDKLRELIARHERLLQEREEAAAVAHSLEDKLEGCRVVIESTKTSQEQTAAAAAASAAATSALRDELAAKSTLNDELAFEIGDLTDENGRLLLQCRQLKRDLRTPSAAPPPSQPKSTASSSRDLTQELAAAQLESSQASATIETLEAENLELKVSFASQGAKVNLQMKSLVRSLRLLSSASEEQDIMLVGEMEQEENSEQCRITEMNYKQILDMEDKNNALFDAVEEASRLANETKGEMKNELARSGSMRETAVKEYKAKLVQLQEECHDMRLSKEGLSTELETLRRESERENQRLLFELTETNNLVVSSVRDEIEKEKRSEVSWDRERLELNGNIEHLKEENEKLHASMKEMDSLVRQEIEKERLSKDSWDHEKCELSATIEHLKEENDTLHSSMKDMNALLATAKEESTSLEDARQYYEQQLQELTAEQEANQYLREEIKSISAEREETHSTCKRLREEKGWLQENIDMLRGSLKDSVGRVERLNSLNGNSAGSVNNEDGGSYLVEGGSASSLSRENEDRLNELTKANKKLTGELEQKHRALQAVQSVLTNLKEEQGAIKETIEALRAENVQLLRRQPAPGPSPAAGGGDHERKLLKLERRIKKAEKENRGLRETSATLSTKLFDEMEKTDALRVANEGLAARICKLVAFIQQTGHMGGSDGGSMSSSADNVAKKSKLPPPPRSKRKK